MFKKHLICKFHETQYPLSTTTPPSLAQYMAESMSDEREIETEGKNEKIRAGESRVLSPGAREISDPEDRLSER